jgi:hypothetical protein
MQVLPQMFAIPIEFHDLRRMLPPPANLRTLGPLSRRMVNLAEAMEESAPFTRGPFRPRQLR